MFTKEELEDLFKDQLVSLGEYYGLEVNMRMLKEEIIDTILEYEEKDEVVEELPPASVRIQRIRESNQE